MLRIVTAEEGVTSVEYALIAAVVGIAAIVGLTQLGSALETAFDNTANDLSTPAVASSSSGGSSSSGLMRSEPSRTTTTPGRTPPRSDEATSSP